MSTEVWFRNPNNYIRELVEVGEYHIAWDRGFLVKSRIDPIKHASIYFGQTYPWRLLAIGSQGTAEYRDGDELDKPTAVYPTWSYGEDSGILEEIVANPIGEYKKICGDMSLPGDERPVLGQEHRVIIAEYPDTRTGSGRKFLTWLKELQEDHPDCIIHLHGTYSWRVAFGMGFRSADVQPREAASKGKIHLPSGSIEKFERAVSKPQWVTPLGFKPADLSIPRNRCMFNIKSARWAAENFMELFKFPVKSAGELVDHESPDSSFKPAETKSHLTTPSKAKTGDKFHCNTCSLQDKCKYFRDGAVCSVPGAEPTELARFFKTRDSDSILEGLSTLAAANARRLERGMREEETLGDINPEVTKMVNQVFDQGVKLAKLVDPSLRGGPKVAINVGAGGAAAISTGNPAQLLATVVRELENRGIPREKQTPEMIEGILEGMRNPEGAQRAIEAPIKGEVIDRD